MGRLNWIWRALWTLSITVGVFGAPARLAAFTSDDNTVRNELLGQCLIHHSVNYEKENARLTVFEPGRFGRSENVGGGNATYGPYFNTPTPLTREFLTICLNDARITVLTLEQNGADSTFLKDDYIGFIFTVSVPLLGKAAGEVHEYKIGSGDFFNLAGPTPEQTREQIAGYMQNRASQTIASQPDLIGLLSGASTGGFNADVTQSNGNFDLATSGDQPIWATLQGSWSEFGTTESSYFFGAVGAHTNISPDALVGITFQFDRLTQTDGASSTEGDGYLVGPYFVAKLPNQPLFIDGRLLTGQTDNEVSVGGAATETFDTQRTFASIKVTGQLNYGE